MNRNRALRLLAVSLVCGVGLCGIARAATPWSRLLTANRVEADPNRTYSLKEANGPWMIMVCSFSGSGAERQAHDLVLELRKRYKVEAYQYDKQFKLDDPNEPGADPTVARRRWVYKKFKDRPPEIQEVAVLVGNYRSAEDPEAQKTLQKLKYSQPECLQPAEGKATSRTLAVMRTFQQALLPDGNEKKKKGPMGHAFCTINPLLPPDYVAPKSGIDPLVLKMNKGVKHSLLDCPGKFTVQVAHFKGETILDQRVIEAIESGRKPGPESTVQGLAKAAQKAHLLTEELRKMGAEAYEFHDRDVSIVTVGSFSSLGMQGADGTIAFDPRIQQIIKQFGAQPVKPADPRAIMAAGAMPAMPKVVEGIPLDVLPQPIPVPKRSISRELAERSDYTDARW